MRVRAVLTPQAYEFACHSPSCAPPPTGTGGSRGDGKPRPNENTRQPRMVAGHSSGRLGNNVRGAVKSRTSPEALRTGNMIRYQGATWKHERSMGGFVIAKSTKGPRKTIKIPEAAFKRQASAPDNVRQLRPRTPDLRLAA